MLTSAQELVSACEKRREGDEEVDPRVPEVRLCLGQARLQVEFEGLGL